MIIQKYQLRYTLYFQPEEYADTPTYGNYCSSPIIIKQATTIIELTFNPGFRDIPLFQIQYLYDSCNPVKYYFLNWFSTFREPVYTNWFNDYI